MSRLPVPLPLRVGVASALAGAAVLAARALGAPWWACAAALPLFALVVHRYVRESFARSLRTATSVISAMRTGDWSVRGRGRVAGDPVAELYDELNAFADQMRRQHLVAEETSALLQTIVAETEIALLAFDGDALLKWANPAAHRLFRCEPGASARALGIEAWFELPSRSLVTIAGQPNESSWELRRGSFWRDRKRYAFFLVSDSTRLRREHERIAWQSLIRVIGHEVNNTLAPIHSLAGTCRVILEEDGAAAAKDVIESLTVIEQRAASLQRFIAEYARVAKLPPPQLGRARISECLRVATEIAGRDVVVRVLGGPDLSIEADVAQLEQALVNIIKNGVEAAQATGGGVSVSWSAVDEDVAIVIADEGAGIENPANLFTPFFTTKPDGSGVGLVLSRNIIENHGGELTVANRRNGPGCVVRIRLPIAAHRAA